MTELSIRPDEIRDAIARNVESFAAGTSREEVGQVTTSVSYLHVTLPHYPD